MIHQMTIACPFDIEEYIHVVQSFHGYKAPGVIIGGFMVNLGKGHLSEGTLFNAICETPVCLPDAIQLLTPCTIGNNRLKILNFGRFALSLFDKDQGNGFRVFLDPEKIDEWPEIKNWFFKIKSKAEQNMELLMAQIKEGGETLCGIHPIRVRPELIKKEKRGEICAVSVLPGSLSFQRWEGLSWLPGSISLCSYRSLRGAYFNI